MLRTEVPQALYSLIMGTNPSRNQGDLRPVDSISWLEAKNFCERLSWILGQPVRLPTENEFRQALGRLRYIVLEETYGAFQMPPACHKLSGQKSHLLAAFTIYSATSASGLSQSTVLRMRAPCILVDTRKTVSNLSSLFLYVTPRGERNRLTGFRIVAKVN